MSLLDYSHVFETTKEVTNKANIKEIDYKLKSEVAGINYKMDQRNAKMKRKINTNPNLFADDNDRDNQLENEIAHHIEKKSWKTLDMCFKWKLITNYLEAINHQEMTTSIKKALLSGKLNNVVFIDDKISRLNFDLI